MKAFKLLLLIQLYIFCLIGLNILLLSNDWLIILILLIMNIKGLFILNLFINGYIKLRQQTYAY